MFGRDFFFPELLLSLIGRFGERKAFLCCQKFAALFRKASAGDHSQNLTALDRLSQIGRNTLDDSGKTRYDMRGTVLVKPDFAGKLSRCFDFGGSGPLDTDGSSFNLLVR